MQKLVFFIDSNEVGLGSNIGKLYMNRFIIDEDAGHEIVKIYEQVGTGHIYFFQFRIFCWSHCQVDSLSTPSFQNFTQNRFII